MTVNEKEILAVLDTIKQDLSRWNQATFASNCGTTMCFAGFAAIRNGYTIDEFGAFVNPAGEPVWGDEFEDKIAEMLGLSPNQAQRIFYYFPENWFPEDRDPTGPELFDLLRDRVFEVTGIEEGK